MFNKLTAFAEKYGMKQDGKMHYYGMMQGYETNLMCNSLANSAPYGFQMHISCYLNDEAKQELKSFEASKPMKIFKLDFTAYGIWIGFNGMTTGSALKGFETALEQILAILNKHSVKGSEYCPMCGEPLSADQSQKISVYDNTITLDKECAGKVEDYVAKEKANYEATPNNIKKGIWGALIGALVGLVITVILFFLNLISAWSPIVGILLGSFLYKKFGGKANGAMIGICFGFTLVFQILAIFLLHVSAANGLAITNGLTERGLDAFNYYMKSSTTIGDGNQTFSGIFTYNMVLSTVFSVIGCVLVSIDIFRKAKAERGF